MYQIDSNRLYKRTRECADSVYWNVLDMIKGSLGGETSVLRTFRMSGKELVKERVSERKS